MRALLAFVLLCPGLAMADAPSGAPTEVVTPAGGGALDAVRLFNEVEVFHLEPGDVRAELRGASGMPSTSPTLEVEAQVGLTPHFQLSLAQAIAFPAGQSAEVAATPIALRYSLGAHEGDVTGNPALEVEVAPRPNAPARAGLRLLVAQELVPRLVVAANGYVAQDIDRGTPAGVDGLLGVTGGASYSLLRGHLHVGAEGRVGAAEYGTPTYSLVLAGGPNAVGSVGPVAATISALFDLTQRRVGFEPMVTLGCTF